MSGTASATDLESRYGRSPRRRRLARALAVAGTAVGTALLISWAAWVGLLSPKPSLEAQTIGYEIVSDQEVVVRYSINTTPGHAVVCALSALSEGKSVVGWRIVELPPSEEYSRSFEDRVATSEQADVGLIAKCRLA